MWVISTEKILLEVQLTTKRNSPPRWRIQIQTTLQKQTGIFVLVNLWVSRAGATKQPTITMTISDESHWYVPALASAPSNTLSLAEKAAHRKWRLHSFPSALLILVQLSGTFTKRWNPAAELCRILYLWRDDRYRWSTNKRWITRDLHSGQIFQLAIKSYLLLTGNDGRKWYVVIIVERAALSLQSCLYDAKKVEKIRIPALRNIKPLMGSDGSDF